MTVAQQVPSGAASAQSRSPEPTLRAPAFRPPLSYPREGTEGQHEDMRLRHAHRGPLALASAGLLAAGLLAACSPGGVLAGGTVQVEKVTGGLSGTYVVPAGIHKIKHVIIVMQENRSFDSYFGTYPGADGIPRKNGVPTACVPDPNGGCTRPYHDTADVNAGGPHAAGNAVADVNGGAMNGFIKQSGAAKATCSNPDNPACRAGAVPDVMGYHTAAEIPNYWAYARNFVLADHMFEPVSSWSLPDHLYMVSAWSAKCTTPAPMSCKNDSHGPYDVTKFDQAVRKEVATGQTSIDLAWTDITWLLYLHHVSWAYYVQSGTQPDCANSAAQDCAPVRQSSTTPGILEPAAAVRRRPGRPPGAQRPGSAELLRGGQGRHAARGELDHPLRREQRAPARQRPPGPGLRHVDRQRRDEEPRLELHRDVRELGRLGRLLRPRGAAVGRPERLRAARAVPAHLAVRPAGLHRPPDAEQRRLPEVHRGRLPGRGPAQSAAPTGVPTRGPTSARRCRSSGTSRPTSTSARRRSSRCCSPPTRRPTRRAIPAYFNRRPPCVGCTTPPPAPRHPLQRP